MDIDKSLDEIISAKPKLRRGGKRGGGAPPTSARARYASAVPKAAAQAAAPAKPLTAEAIKIIISNLPQDVTEAAVRDLMQSTVGPVRTVQMSYNATGKSTGVATVVFKNRGDANKAHAALGLSCSLAFGEEDLKQVRQKSSAEASPLSRVLPSASKLTNITKPLPQSERPMKVEIAIDPNQAQSLASRVAAPPPARGAANPRGRGRGRGGARPRNPRPAKKTAEELDAEMTAYKETGTA
uniref:THO complex subunit 4 n=1 Tax=Kwoniella bestiolae CBS 10118 TaxID=1296100 RepID=A0A1B9FY51_9TREE|nr:THO complex subunit 4 [Kwoniella bestiolae CBS 10118]OCF23680.1 THO complex subunit 4 [Kwoniella bestiolae CBS 10118]